MSEFTVSEHRFYDLILKKEVALREYLATNMIEKATEPAALFQFLNGLKNVLGNLNNDVSFSATLLIKNFLKERFSVADFDAGGKAQGASGIDIEAKTFDGKVIIGELKTTKPYQPGFGAAQRTSILKDLNRLKVTPADFRFMFVTDDSAYATLSGERYRKEFSSVEIVNLALVRTRDVDGRDKPGHDA